MLCTCRGFKVHDLIKLCQAHRTHSMEEVTSKLKDSLCSFCDHPLHFHSTRDIAGDSNLASLLRKKPLLGPHHGLSLKASSLLAFSPANSSCLELLMPADVASEFFMVAVGKFRSSENLQLAVLSGSATESTDSTSVMEEIGLSHLNGSEVETPAVSMVGPTNTSLACGHGSSPNFRGVKKGKTQRASEDAGHWRSRRSTRLATKRARLEEEDTKKTLKGLKGFKRLHEEDDDGIDDDENFSGERELIGERSASFVTSLGKKELYSSYPLPQVCVHVAYVCLQDRDTILFSSVIYCRRFWRKEHPHL